MTCTGTRPAWCSAPAESIASARRSICSRSTICFPSARLNNLLGLVRSLTAKIDVINQTGFLDASILGEVVTPRDFNTLRRIADEDNSVIEEQESFLELA